jgi:hypothetical protein
MGKVIRLTESELTRLIKNVIQEQEIDYEGITNELKTSLIGTPTQFTPRGKQGIQFKISDVKVPDDLLTKARTVTLIGSTGTYTQDGFIPSVEAKEVYVTYRCKTSSDESKSSKITYEASMMSLQGQGTLNGNMTMPIVNDIETIWCKKLPPMPNSFR